MPPLFSTATGLIRAALLSFLIGSFAIPSIVHAQGGMALGGTFSDQEFELPQGASISNPSVYIIVFNQSTAEMNVRMSATTPFGVEVSFSKSGFLLPPNGEQKVYVTVKVTEDAVPGKYEIIVSAQVVPKEGKGVAIATAGAQKASLVVTGESALIQARVVTPDGKPIPAQVRLFKVIEDKLNELALSETGMLEAKVSPGVYRLAAFIGSRKLAEETVTVSTKETKEVTLTVKPVYFEFFGIEPNYAPDNKQLTFVRMVYTLNNLSEPMGKGEIILQVSLDGKPLEQVSLVSLSRLDIGRTEGNYRYLPEAGWIKGNYGLRLGLYIEGKLYIDSNEEKLEVGAGITPTTPSSPPVVVQFEGVKANEVLAVPFEGVDVTGIEIRARTTITQGEMKIQPLTELSPDVPAVAAARVYGYFEVSTEQIAAEAVEVAVIKFKVAKSWLEEGSGAETTLYRYNAASSRWDALLTQRITDDAEYVYYSTESPGLSFFAIASVRSAARWPGLLGLSMVWRIVAGVAVIVAATALIFVVRTRRRELPEKPPVEKPAVKKPPTRPVEKPVEKLAPRPPVALRPATRNLTVKSYDSQVKQGAACNIKITFEYQGPALTGTIRIAIGKREASGFGEKAYIAKRAAAPEARAWKTFPFNASIATATLRGGTYDLYARVYGGFPETTSPYLRNVITIVE